ncbi:hypothetical protein JCM10213_004674 [Rhodosporidiobolus nylandii]
MLPSAPYVAGQPQEENQQPPATPSRPSGVFATAKAAASTALHVAQLVLHEGGLNGAQETGPPKHLLFSLLEQLKEGTLAKDAMTIVSAATQATEAIDDRKMLLEQVIQLLSTLPPDSPIGPVLQNQFIRLLWNDLQHPPVSFVGDSRYRSADGSGNNLFMPTLGAAGQPYARTVSAVHPQPDRLPEPSVVFDVLMKRREFTPHPSGISSLLFAFATLITHSCFNTNREDPNINDASSYLDLSPLYGNNEEELAKIRTYYQGEIHEDVVASQRLFLMPPATIALALVFSRNHNWIVRKLVEVNQHGRFQPWESLGDEERREQDEELFQTARLVNCGAFQNIIFQDYIRVILHVNQTMSTWSLVPTGEIKSLVDGTLPRGEGNAVSVEFNLLYRWHSAVSEADERWIEGLMRRFCNKPFDDMTAEDFRIVYKGLSEEMGDDPQKWTFGGLRRTGEDGKGPFADKDIVRVFTEATDQVAGAFKARGVPAVMKVIDVLGMAISRMKWQTGTLNEFRHFLNLTEFKSFEEWNSDPVIAEAARRLYKDVDNLELMPGLACEEAKPSMEGSGLCPGYTISRAILSDAASLVRGDRYLTSDYTAGNLTSYQWKDLQPDLQNGAFGGYISKLLLRHFPQFYTFNSTYALFPFTTPHTTGGILKNLKIAERYDARRPTESPDWAVVRSRKAAEAILGNEDRFKNVYGPHLAALQDKYPEPAFMSHFKALDTPAKRAQALEVIEAGMMPPHWVQMLNVQVGEATKQHIVEQAWAFEEGGRFQLDLVKDLAVPVAMNHLAKILGLPMKGDKVLGVFTPQSLYEALATCNTFCFKNFDPSIGYRLREDAKRDADVVRSIVMYRLAQTDGTPAALHTLAESVRDILTAKAASSKTAFPDTAHKFYSRILDKSKRPIEELAGIVTTAAVLFVNVVPAFVNAVDFFLAPKNAKAFQQLCTAVQANTGMLDDSTISRYIEEALRLQPSVAGVARRAMVDTTIQDGQNRLSLAKGQMVFVDLGAANRDPTVFTDPEKISTTRDAGLYKLSDRQQGITNHAGESYNNAFVVSMIRELLQHPDLKMVDRDGLGRKRGPLGIPQYLRDDSSNSSFPVSMSVSFMAAKANRS